MSKENLITYQNEDLNIKKLDIEQLRPYDETSDSYAESDPDQFEDTWSDCRPGLYVPNTSRTGAYIDNSLGLESQIGDT